MRGLRFLVHKEGEVQFCSGSPWFGHSALETILIAVVALLRPGLMSGLTIFLHGSYILLERLLS